MTNIYKMSTEDPISGILRFSWTVILQPHFRLSKSLTEFAVKAANKVEILFDRGVYVDENTAQAASVEFVCQWQTNYARSRLQRTGGKARRGFSTSANAVCP